MKFRRFETLDWFLYLIPILLVAVGVATIYTITYISKGSSLALNQLIYAIIGIGLMVGLSFFDYRLWKSIVWIFYAIGIIMLLILVVPPLNKLPFVVMTMGATRWIDLGFTQLQPSEFFKPILILTLAAYCSKYRKDMNWKKVLIAILITLIPVLLTLKQPDLGTSLVLLVILGAALVTVRLERIYYFIIGGAVLFIVPLLWFFLKDYQKQRIVVFLDPQSDPSGAGYNVLQSIIAVGSGGMTGRGLGQGSQSQLNFLPVAHTDFIFAGFAEATGFVGAVVLISMFLFLLFRILNVAKISKDDFGMFVATGAGTMIIFQMFVNIGMNISLMPVTGIPLPFVSSGGTSLIISFMMMGILQSIFLRHKKISF